MYKQQTVKVTTGNNVTSFDDSSTSFHINKGEVKETILNNNIQQAISKGILIKVTE